MNKGTKRGLSDPSYSSPKRMSSALVPAGPTLSTTTAWASVGGQFMNQPTIPVSVEQYTKIATEGALVKRMLARKKMVESGRMPPLLAVLDDVQRGKWLAGYNVELSDIQKLQYKGMKPKKSYKKRATRTRRVTRTRAPARRRAAPKTTVTKTVVTK